MVEAAEASGDLTPEKTILEPTSGNTCISLAMVARWKGYHLTVVLPDNASQERLGLLRLFGAEIVFSDGDKGTNGSIEVVAPSPRTLLHAVPVRNPANPRGARRTGREIVADLPEVTHFVAGMGPAARSPAPVGRCTPTIRSIRVVAAEPSSATSSTASRSLDEGFIPPIFDPSEVNRKFLVRSDDAVRATRELTSRRASSQASRPAPRSTAQRIAAEVVGGGDVVCPLADGGVEVPVDRGLAEDLATAEKQVSESLWW